MNFDSYVKLHISEEFYSWLIENGFNVAPASTKYHGNFCGGLFAHSQMVAEVLLNLTDKLNLRWGRKESPFIIGVFHDLCKIDNYRFNEDEKCWEYANPELTGHGEKSVILLERFLVLTEEERNCIRYHMGAFIPDEMSDYGKVVQKFPNVLWTHTADMIASKLKGI